MPVPPPFFGDGATLGLGGGPIRSQDQNIASFGTGTVNFGSDKTATLSGAIIVLVLIGALLWLTYNFNR